MDIHKFIQNQEIKIDVIPKAKKTELAEKDRQLKLYVKAVPEKDKANQKIISFFKKNFGLKVKIKFGSKSRKKVLKIIN